MVDKDEVLDYARRIKEERPKTSKEEMRKLLLAKFEKGEDIFETAAAKGLAVGALNNPVDWLRGLGKIAKGLSRWFGNDDEAEALREVIDGVIEILY